MTSTLRRSKSPNGYVWVYVLAFLTPLLLAFAAMWRAGVYPFGSLSMLTMDGDIQYADLFVYLKHALEGDASLLYSFGKSLGGNMWGVFSYYLSSPLNLLVVFFSDQAIPYFVIVITCLKIALCGVTMAAFLRGRFQLAPLMTVLLSSCYAMSQYMMTQASNIMWLDSVVLLPLVMLGVFHFIREKKAVLYVASLAGAILFNWYTGYMICLFTALYFILESVTQESYQFRGKAKAYGARLLHFAGVSALAVGISAVSLLPTIFALRQGKGNFNLSFLLRPGFYYSPLDTLRGLTIANGAGRSPGLYCGILALVLCVLFFVNKRISKQERIVTAVFLAFLLVSCCYMPLDAVWSGMRFAYSYYYRYGFVIAFLLIYIAGRSAQTMLELGNKDLVYGGCGNRPLRVASRRNPGVPQPVLSICIPCAGGGLFAVVLFLEAPAFWKIHR